MKTVFKVVLPILTCLLSIAGVVLGSVAVAKAYKEPEFYYAHQIGLSEIFQYDATEMFVDGPQLSGYTTTSANDDKELVDKVFKELRETLLYEMYSPAKKPEYSTSGYCSLTFCVNNSIYSFSAVADGKLKVVINGETEYYFIGGWFKVWRLIGDTADYVVSLDNPKT